jgi:O-antigen ligase
VDDRWFIPRTWAVPLLFGVFVYLAIDSYALRAFGNYNRQVAGYALTAAATLLLIASFGGRRFRSVAPMLPLGMAFALSVAVSTWRAPHLYWALDQLHLYYAGILLGAGLYLMHRGDGTRTVSNYLVVVPMVHMIFLVLVIFWLIWIQNEPGVVARGLPYFANIRHFAYHGFIAAACAASLFTINSRFEFTAFVMTTASLFGIVLLGARGALLAWIVFAAFLLVFHDRRVRLALFCVTALAVAAAVAYCVTEAHLLQVTSLFQRLDGSDGTAFRVGDRLGIWIDAVHAIAQRPLLGYGPEGFMGSRCCNPAFVQPHNVVLQFLLEFGLVGSGLMIATICAMIRACGGATLIGSNLRSDPALLAVCAVLVGFGGYAAVDGLLYHAIPLIHFALLIALLFATMARLKGGAIRGSLSPSRT